MNAKLLLGLLKKILLIANAKKVYFSILPYVFCALLLMTSSCTLMFDKNGSRNPNGRDDQYYDHGKYEQHEEGDRNGMNQRQEDYNRNGASGQR